MALSSAVFSIYAQLVSGLHDGFLASRRIQRFAVPGSLGVGDAKVDAGLEHGAERDTALTRSLLQNMLGACLEVPESHAGEISMWQCEDMNPKQQWVYDEHTGQIRGTHGSCLHALERNTIGGQVRMQECNETSSHQQWALNRSTGQIRNREGICLDGTNAGDLRMRQCDTSSLLAKEWSLLDPETMIADMGEGEAEHWPGGGVDEAGNHHLVLPKYSWFRFIPTGLRGDDNPPLVQLAEIIFAGADGSDIDTCGDSGVHAFGPGGWSPIDEGPKEAIDCKTNTKWVDLTVQALIVKFPEAVTATAFTFITANDSVKRDPVQWELEGARDGRNWVLLHSTEGVPAPISENRGVRNNWFPLHLHGPPTSTTTTTPTTTTMTTPTTSTTTSSTDSHTSTITTTATTYTSYTTLTKSTTTTHTTTSHTSSTSATSFTTATISTMTFTSATPTTRTFTTSTRTTTTRTFTSLTHTTLTFTTLTFSSVTPTTVTTSTTHTTTTTPTSLTLTTTHTTFTTATPTTLTPTTVTMTTATTSTTTPTSTFTTTSTATNTHTSTSTATKTHTSFTTATTSTTHTTSTTATDTSTLTTGTTITTATPTTATLTTLTTRTRTITGTSETISATSTSTVPTTLTSSSRTSISYTRTTHTGSTWPADSNTHVFKYFRFTVEATRDWPERADMIQISEIHMRGAGGYAIPWGSLQARLQHQERECKNYGWSLGLHSSADDCAIHSRIYKDCNYISFAPLDPTQECRCCTSSNPAGSSSRSLYEVWYTAPNEPRQVVATNPLGDQPLDEKGESLEGPLKTLDGDTGTKWLDYSTEPMILEFTQPVAANAFTFSTGNDFPNRDPVQWIFEGSDDGQTWFLLHRTEGAGEEGVTLDREMKSEWYPFAFNANMMSCCYAYPVFRFIPMKTRSPVADCYQIAEFYLMGADYETPHANVNFLASGSGKGSVAVTASNPNGDSPDEEKPEKIIDDHFDSKFLDFNIEPVVFTFARAVRVLAFSYVTANDFPERDPVQWLVQGSHDGVEWVDLHSTNGVDANIPTARKTQTSLYLFHMPSVANTVHKLTMHPEQN